MRRNVRMAKSQLKSVETYEGESIERKVERLVNNNEPIGEGSPEIFTERKDGVLAAYNIRTDRWELAAEAMDVRAANIAAKREAKAEGKVIDMKPEGEKKTEGKKEGEGKA